MPRSVWLLAAARAVNRLGAFSVPFLAALTVVRFGASPVTAGLVTAAFGVATIPSRLLGGRLADRIGRRRSIVLGLAGCAVAQLAIAAAGTVWQVLAFAVLLGLVYEIYEPASQAMIADAVGPADRARAYSLFSAALAAGGTGAGLIAAAVGRWDLRWLFVIDAASCLACAVVVRRVLPLDRPLRAGTKRTGASPWRDPALLALLGCGTFYALVYTQVTVALPLSMRHSGLDAADAGILFTVAAVSTVAGQPLLRLGRLAALSTPVMLASGCVLLAAGFAGYAFVQGLVPLALATVVWSAGDLLIFGRVYATVADLAPPDGRGHYLSVYGLSWGFAAVIAPVTATWTLQHAGVAALWTGTAALCLVLAAFQFLVVKPLLPDAPRDDAPVLLEPAPAPAAS
ncbi:MFS transporter [Actinomadura rupiterrae]|uniref:MFS transporter n=1 Tax=Actinomadura rupiterrae TaxID=559627 RepID=UPI0020A275A5|nr:MFS transporter [Actinomadura rupiterrae]MCP2337099.1 MFS family permease [Actinomadura rupiterrae]